MKQRSIPLLAHLGQRLFYKIFLAFWVAMTLAGGVLLKVETTRTALLAQRFRGVAGDALAVYAASAAQNLEAPPSSESTTAAEFLDDLEQRTSIRAWLFDSRDREVSGFSAQERQRQPGWLRLRIGQLVSQARSSGNTEFADLEGLTLAARPVTTPEGRTYVLAGTLPDARYDFWGASSQVQMLRLLSILVVAGAVSWVLAHHLTQPLEELRALAQRMASGDFSARAETGLNRRRDELAELAGDFNGMAEQIENLLQEKERLLGAQRHLLADVAHELRSPLTRATVALELGRDALDENLGVHQAELYRVTESLDRIERENGNLSELIDRLLMLSRLESGVQRPERTPINLTAMVHAIVADADFEARSRNRTVKLLHVDVCQTQGTSSLIRSAIENVVRNAITHTPPETAVEVELHVEEASPHSENKQGQWAVVTVRDAGPGVPDHELNEIFRPFYRAGSGRPRQSGGAGLGLTITARAMELHGGQYRISNLPEKGLEVQLRFALLQEN